MRTLIAGFGNALRGDDGFGVEVIRRLQLDGIEAGVELMDVGTGGIRLAQELLTPYDRLIIVDAVSRGQAPGTVSVVAIDEIETVAEIDMHVAIPARALSVAKALGALPAEVYMVGCEPLQVDELRIGLSEPVRAAIEIALHRVRELVARPAMPAGAVAR